MQKNIIIIGANDSLAGQVINFLPLNLKKKIKCVIYDRKLVKKKKTKINLKIETVNKKKIFGYNFLQVTSFKDFFKEQKINQAYLLVECNFQRQKIYEEIKSFVKFLTYIHPSTILSGKNVLGDGSILFPGSYVGYKANIGKLTIIQSNCTIEHHNEIGDFCNIAPKVTTGGFTEIENFCNINISANIINRVNVAENCIIGAGSLILKNTSPNGLYFGIPAKRISNNKKVT